MEDRVDAPWDAEIAAQRDYFIPVRKAAVMQAVLGDPDLGGKCQGEQLGRFDRLLGSILHFEYFAKLESLRESYLPVDPEFTCDEHVTPDVFARNYAAFSECFASLLEGANFVEVTPQEIDRAHSEHAALNVKVQARLEDYHAVRFFRRGLGLETFECKTWFGLRKQSRDVDVYKNVVLMAAIKPHAALDEAQVERLNRQKINTGCVLIKCFRNIASADLNVLLPNVRVKMSLFDKLMMAVPALLGGVPILLKLVSSLTVLFVVIGFYLGLRGAVEDEEMKSAIVALGGLVALGAFLIRQWAKYERQSLRYLKELTEKVFFRSVNHNAGFFDYVLGAAEEQDYKEALLAYIFLLGSRAPQSEEDLRVRVENWLKNRFPIVVRFEVGDALAKLARWGLLDREQGGLAVIPLDAALAQLSAVWNGFFPPDASKPKSNPQRLTALSGEARRA